MWPRNIQNGFENVCASLGFEADTFGVEGNRFTNSATPQPKQLLSGKVSGILRGFSYQLFGCFIKIVQTQKVMQRFDMYI